MGETVEMSPIYASFSRRDLQSISRILDPVVSNSKIQRADGNEAIEIVASRWTASAGKTKTSEFNSREKRKVEETLRTYFSDTWTVRWKTDKRKRGDITYKRMMIRREVGTTFKLREESQEEYILALEGPPENAPEDAVYYSDIFEEPPEAVRNENQVDIYVYESSTGTTHFMWGSDWYDIDESETVEGLREAIISEDFPCICGHKVEPEEIIDEVQHYGEVVADWEGDAERVNPLPHFVMGHDHLDDFIADDGVCTKCAKALGLRDAPSYYPLAEWVSSE